MKLTFISSYPPKSVVHAAQTVGVASYTKVLITKLQKLFPRMPITVYAETFGKKVTYKENKTVVKRYWKRGNTKSILMLLVRLFLAKKSTTIITSFEAFMFGSPRHTALALIGLLLIKASGKKQIIILHQVIDSFAPIEKNIIKRIILTLAKNVVYTALLSSSTKLIVFEQELKTYLGNHKKVVVIPHAILPIKPLIKRAARKKLGLSQNRFIVLCFGFLAPYKALDWLVVNWPTKKADLIIAGGQNPNHTGTLSYKRFAEGLESKAKETGITITGFVKEDDIALYFTTVNAVIFPYKVFFSSSGPLSLAFSHEKPVLFSKPLKAYEKTDDIKQALKKAKLRMQDITFEFSAKDLEKKLLFVKKNHKKLAHFSIFMKKERNLERIAKQLYNNL